MKKVFFFLALITFFSFSKADAQPVTVQNYTDCEILWDVVAICPDNPCTEYSTRTMNILSAGQSFGPCSPLFYPWYLGVIPPCSNWRWAYAYITIGDENGCLETLKVGYEDCKGTLGPNDYHKSSKCTCNGQTVVIHFNINPANGDCVITVSS